MTADPLSPKARAQLAVLDETKRKWDRVRAIVEQVAARRGGMFRGGGGSLTDGVRIQPSSAVLLSQLGRLVIDVMQLLEERGFREFADQLQELAALARRGERAPQSATYRMREIVNHVYTGLGLAEQEVKGGDQQRPPGEEPAEA
ncbi:MAG: hypothetical protein OEO20_12385 [Gemmatimonadota bacterium]|nr:hypothetical protein [Gemmatimonadota bacterium]MDH3366469.1 hypothetical protein [Gemmatimonadota bacterium]MDH3479092.1 hypothetical protein [Gemmatimonadota bacterium]MDH3571039.1 hypothetical protein [Gemmatimonadota bacterium]MDH5549211.1 hypothetical protein [Gemmatimonadota bacterium]